MKYVWILALLFVVGAMKGVTAECDGSQQISISFMGSYDTPAFAAGLDIVGDTAYIADEASGVQIIDVSNPLLPVYIGNFDSVGWTQDVIVRDNIAYVAAYSSGFLHIVNVTNPGQPVLISSYSTPRGINRLSISGDYAYLALGDSGMQIVNISNLGMPTLVGTLDTPGLAWGIYVKDDYAYVADASSGLQIIDVSDPHYPTVVGNYDTPGESESLVVVGDIAYVANSEEGVFILDVSNPYLPLLIANRDTDRARNLYVSGDFVYVADYYGGLKIVNVSNPALPNIMATFDTPDRAMGVKVVGDYVYVADASSGVQILKVAPCQYDEDVPPTMKILRLEMTENGNPSVVTANNNLLSIQGQLNYIINGTSYAGNYDFNFNMRDLVADANGRDEATVTDFGFEVSHNLPSVEKYEGSFRGVVDFNAEPGPCNDIYKIAGNVILIKGDQYAYEMDIRKEIRGELYLEIATDGGNCVSNFDLDFYGLQDPAPLLLNHLDIQVQDLYTRVIDLESKSKSLDNRTSLLEQWKTTVDNTIQAIQNSITSILSRILVLEGYHQPPQPPVCEPACNQFQDCVNGTCVWKPGCCGSTCECTDGKICVNNQCVDQSTTRTPIADTYVYAMAPTANYGASSKLMIRGYGAVPARSYFRFDTSGLGSVQSAKLHVKAYSGSGTVKTDAHFVSDDTWTEAINWNNKPSYDVTAMDSQFVSSDWVVWDVTNAFNLDSNGLFSVMLKYTNENEQKYNNLYSKDSSIDKPYLEVTYS